MQTLRLALVWSTIYLLVVGLGLHAVRKESVTLAALVFVVGVLTTQLVVWLLYPIIVGGSGEEVWARFLRIAHLLTRG